MASVKAVDDSGIATSADESASNEAVIENEKEETAAAGIEAVVKLPTEETAATAVRGREEGSGAGNRTERPGTEGSGEDA